MASGSTSCCSAGSSKETARGAGGSKSAATPSPARAAAGPSLSNSDLAGLLETNATAEEEEPCEECRRGGQDGEHAGETSSRWLTEENKDAFLAALERAVCATANDGLAGTGSTAEGCPWIRAGFRLYAGYSAAQLARSIARFAPETEGVASQTSIVSLLAARVRRSVDQWAASGEITGLPDDMPLRLPGAGLLGGVFFQGRTGAAPARPSPALVRARLGSGRPLPGAVRSRMEEAFGGASFSHVRLHSDPAAAALTQSLQARALAVGEHIAFAGGEYRPGTPVGDALMAHELAHVLQQQAAQPGSAGGPSAESAAEADANHAAASVVGRLWGDAGPARLPRMRAGLQLHRCGAAAPTVRTGTGAGAAGTLDCPTLPAVNPPTPGRGRNPLDARGAGIIAMARDTSVPVPERGVRLVTAIICQYYPGDRDKVESVVFDSGVETGLETQSIGTGAGARGRIKVSTHFVTSVPEHLAHEVLRVRHELDHIQQYRDGLAGHNNRHEREFLAFAAEALAAEPPGTGRMLHSTRIDVIDAALRHFHCLSAEKQTEYRARRDELLTRRREEQSRIGNAPTDPPTSCEGRGSE